MKRKAQSALEYMMTYGWAILIIVIVAGVLYSLGIFNPSANSGTTATGFSPFVVLGQNCNSTGFYLQFGNDAGATTSVKLASTGVVINSQSGFTTSITVANFSSSTQKWSKGGNLTTSTNAISPGAVVYVTTTAYGGSGGTCISAGVRYSATITLTYTEVTTVGTQTLSSTGTVAGPAA